MPLKSASKRTLKRLFGLQNIRLGSMTLFLYRLPKSLFGELARWLQKIVSCCDVCWFTGMLWSFVTTLCSPNEDFARMNKRWHAHFRGTFQGCEYLIWAKIHWKLLRNDTANRLFRFPKSSFGEHKLCKMITKACDVCWFTGMLWSFVTTLQDDYKR